MREGCKYKSRVVYGNALNIILEIIILEIIIICVIILKESIIFRAERKSNFYKR